MSFECPYGKQRRQQPGFTGFRRKLGAGREAKSVQPKHEGLVWKGEGVPLHHFSDWCKLEQPSRWCRASSAQSSSGCIPAEGRSMCSHWFIFSLIITLLWCPEQPGESNSNSGLLGRGTNIAIRFGKPWISCKGQCYLSPNTSCLAHTVRCKYNCADNKIVLWYAFMRGIYFYRHDDPLSAFGPRARALL